MLGLDLVKTAQKKAVRFARGLNEPLHRLALTHIPMGATFESLVDMALLHEEDKNSKKEVKPNETQNKKADFKNGNNKNNKGNNKPRETRKCNFRGITGHLAKDCRKKKRKLGECFHCGDTGHINKD